MSLFACLVLIKLVFLSVSNANNLAQEVEILKAQNDRLLATVEKLEQRITMIENVEPKTKSVQRRGYEGPTAFTYRLDKTKINIQNSQTIRFPIKITDLGGGYDNHTGVFTAPRPGLYMITCSLLADHSDGANPMLHAAIVVNGKIMAKVFAFSESGTHRDQGSNTIFVNLNAGGKVWVKGIDSSRVTIGGDHYSTFSGYLLWQT